MDIGAVLSRAFKITFQYPLLWLLMLVPVLLTALSGAISAAQGFAFRPQDFIGVESFEEMLAAYARIFSVLLPLLALQLAITLLAAIIGLVVRGGVISAVNTIESNGSPSFASALATGFRKAIPLLVFNILLVIPVVLIGLLIFVLIGLPFLPLLQGAAGGNLSPETADAIAGGFFAALCAIAAVFCVLLVYGLLVAGIQVMGERAIVLEDAGPIGGLMRGWALLRAHLGQIILLAIILFIITFVIGFVLGTVSNLAVLPQMGNWMEQLSEGLIPEPSELINWPIFIAITLVSAVVSLFVELFIMVIWTLAYRQFIGASPARLETPAAPLPV
ncbi:MAG: hypothetical protein RMN25_09850 [Anaerolineae bacterium]|nr:hypothetical protein [Thermoflexales bacterium]MDW8408071.1 hypothetical protein [Anaerolineae bacterium]